MKRRYETELPKLPQGWSWATLPMLGEFGRGKSKHRPRNDERLYTDGKYPFFQTGRVRNSDGSIREYDKLYSDFGLAQSKLWPAGTVCITIAANIAESGILKFDGCFPDSIVGLVPHPEISGLFVEAFIRTAKEDLDRYAPATAQKNINLEILSSVSVPIPPANEQQRIVEKVETLFARLDKGEEAVREVQKLLKRYRQSILKSAVTGELTADWRAEREGELESGADLLARILKTREENWQGRGKYKAPVEPDTTNLPNLPEGWVWASLGQLIYKIEAGKNYRCQEVPPASNQTGIVKISAVTWDEFNQEESKTIISDDHLNDTLLINDGDLSISRANTIELVGASVVVRNISKRLQLSDKVLRLKCVEPIEHWVNYLLKSWVGRLQIEAMATGAQMSMRNISQKNLEKIAVPLPPSEEIAAAIEMIVGAFDKEVSMSKICETELKRSDALRQSILKDAFSGRLVPQDPDDEPASALLERIQQSKKKRK